MKAILEFNLPEEQDDHAYALAGIDAILLINDLENEIRAKLRHDCGEFSEFYTEEYDDDGNLNRKKVKGCDNTLEQVWKLILDYKRERNIPELS